MATQIIHAADATPQSIAALRRYHDTRGPGEEVAFALEFIVTALTDGRNVVLTTVDPEPSHHELDMDKIVQHISAAGYHATVEQTGGNVATIFAGRTHLDSDGCTRYQLLAGPGHYTWGHGPNMSHTEEFSWGPDDDGEGPFVEAEAGDDEASIARKIVARLIKLNTQEV